MGDIKEKLEKLLDNLEKEMEYSQRLLQTVRLQGDIISSLVVMINVVSGNLNNKDAEYINKCMGYIEENLQNIQTMWKDFDDITQGVITNND